MLSKLNEFRRGGKALFGATVGAGCGLSSISFYTHGVFVPAIVADTGWSRGDVQFGVTIMILMAIFTAPSVGFLIDRYGARNVALISIVFPLLTSLPGLPPLSPARDTTSPVTTASSLRVHQCAA